MASLRLMASCRASRGSAELIVDVAVQVEIVVERHTVGKGLGYMERARVSDLGLDEALR